ncbi:hypothetical protein Hanom_Chr00s000001g01597761 [Helianthus anomalus]
MLADKVDPDEATFANVLRSFSVDRIGHYNLNEIYQLCSLGVTVSKFHLNFQFKFFWPQILAETRIFCWRSLVYLVIHLCNYNENFRLLHLTLIHLRWLLIMFNLIVPPFTSICMMFLKHHNCLPF